MNELKYLNKYFLKYRYRIILGILITIGSKIFALFTPQLIGKSITLISDQITNPSSTEIFRYEISLNILYIFGAATATRNIHFFDASNHYKCVALRRV